MLNKLIDLGVENRLLVVLALLATLVGAALILPKLNLDYRTENGNQGHPGQEPGRGSRRYSAEDGRHGGKTLEGKFLKKRGDSLYADLKAQNALKEKNQSYFLKKLRIGI